jgi:hypothetical protein
MDLSPIKFRTEEDLVRLAIRYLPFDALLGVGRADRVFIAKEVRGFFGIPDVVAASFSGIDEKGTKSIAFEMKLSDWRRALIQAYRYKSFAMSVYVVLDHGSVSSALRNIDEFTRANVGLISVFATGIVCHRHPMIESPFSDQLRDRFDAWVCAGRGTRQFPKDRRLRDGTLFSWDQLPGASSTSVACTCAHPLEPLPLFNPFLLAPNAWRSATSPKEVIGAIGAV